MTDGEHQDEIARLKAKCDQWRAGSEALQGEMNRLAAEFAAKSTEIERLKMDNAALVQVGRFFEPYLQDVAKNGGAADMGWMAQSIAAELMAIIDAKHPGFALLEQHAKALEYAPFQCCGGSDERPPEHTQDCRILVRARNEGLEHGARICATSGHPGLAFRIRAMKEAE